MSRCFFLASLFIGFAALLVLAPKPYRAVPLPSDRKEAIDWGVARDDVVAAVFEECQASPDELPPGAASDCLLERFEAGLRELGPYAMLNGLGAYRLRIGGTQCHEAAHLLGQAGMRVYSRIEEGFQPKLGLCEYGWYHGLMQGWALKSGPDQVVEEFATLCDRVKVEGTDPDCVHALGHAVSVFLDPGVVERACSSLWDRTARLKCWYGYEMELAADTAARVKAQGGPSAADRAAAEVEFAKCGQLAHPDIRDSCYQYREGTVFYLVGEDEMKVAGLCGDLPSPDAVRLCFTGAGGELMATHSGVDIPGAPMPMDFCGMATQALARTDCLQEIAYVRMLVLNTLEGALEVCRTGGELAAACERQARQDYQEYLDRQGNAAGTGQLSVD